MLLLHQERVLGLFVGDGQQCDQGCLRVCFYLHSWVDSNSAEECTCVLDVWVVGSDQLRRSVSLVFLGQDVAGFCPEMLTMMNPAMPIETTIMLRIPLWRVRSPR